MLHSKSPSWQKQHVDTMFKEYFTTKTQGQGAKIIIHRYVPLITTDYYK